MKANIANIIFDLGGVLMDWDPRYLYNKIFDDKEKMEWFLSNVCTLEWNAQQDAGRTFEEATSVLIKEFPEYKDEILAFDHRWEETIKGAYHETVEVLESLAETGIYQIFALTNWSHEKFPFVREKYSFYKLFKDILVSGEEKMIKPNLAIYALAQKRFKVEPQSTLFIDDNTENIAAAQNFGFQTVHFKESKNIIDYLNN